MKKVVDEMDKKQENYEVLVKMYFCELFIVLMRILKNKCKFGDKASKSYLDAAINFIELSISQDLSPGIIAKSIHISPDYLMHLFKEYMGCSVMNFVMLKRIEISKNMLKNTNKKVTEIASRVGIPNSQYFSTIFKKYSGMTPSQFRRISQMTNNSDLNIFK